MRISDWSSDVCSSDLTEIAIEQHHPLAVERHRHREIDRHRGLADAALAAGDGDHLHRLGRTQAPQAGGLAAAQAGARSEEHTSELQSLMRISYAVFCLKKKKTKTHTLSHN